LNSHRKIAKHHNNRKAFAGEAKSFPFLKEKNRIIRKTDRVMNWGKVI